MARVAGVVYVQTVAQQEQQRVLRLILEQYVSNTKEQGHMPGHEYMAALAAVKLKPCLPVLLSD